MAINGYNHIRYHSLKRMLTKVENNKPAPQMVSDATTRGMGMAWAVRQAEARGEIEKRDSIAYLKQQIALIEDPSQKPDRNKNTD